MSSSEERKDEIKAELSTLDRRLYEERVELGEQRPMGGQSLKHWLREYLRAERALIASLGARETVAYLQAKSELLHEHAEEIR